MDTKKLLSIMAARNISMYRLAKLLGTSNSTISDIVSRRNRNPRIDTVARIASALDVCVDDLLEDRYRKGHKSRKSWKGEEK